MSDLVQIERTDLRKLAICRHERMVGFGRFAHNGWSCQICKGEWDKDAPEFHAETCPLNARE